MDPGWSFARGLVKMRRPYPLIVRQTTDQNADTWPILRDEDLPIFTEHLPEQRLPFAEVFFFLIPPWQAAYYNEVFDYVEVGPDLTAACGETLKAGSDPVGVRADGGLDTLTAIPDMRFSEWLQEHRDKKRQNSSPEQSPEDRV